MGLSFAHVCCAHLSLFDPTMNHVTESRPFRSPGRTTQRTRLVCYIIYIDKTEKQTALTETNKIKKTDKKDSRLQNRACSYHTCTRLDETVWGMPSHRKTTHHFTTPAPLMTFHKIINRHHVPHAQQQKEPQQNRKT